MLKLISDLPDYVLGVAAHGEVTGEDYESTLVPAIEKITASHRRLRLLYVLGSDFKGYTGAAAWEDAKVGMRHFTAFDRQQPAGAASAWGTRGGLRHTGRAPRIVTRRPERTAGK